MSRFTSNPELNKQWFLIPINLLILISVIQIFFEIIGFEKKKSKKRKESQFFDKRSTKIANIIFLEGVLIMIALIILKIYILMKISSENIEAVIESNLFLKSLLLMSFLIGISLIIGGVVMIIKGVIKEESKLKEPKKPGQKTDVIWKETE